ncbi:MAG TPA: glycoside hydrolase family 66 protein [Anaerolineae bacterium]|nr:glycoside hydrolase family 66 protein [Anaerolineae bacterium]
MVRLDVYPAQSTFAPGETVQLIAAIEAEATARAVIHLSIDHLASDVAQRQFPIALMPGRQAVTLSWESITIAPRGYGVEVELMDRDGNVLAIASTAFDILDHWTQAPRYGFLTDFAPGRDNIEETLRALTRFHINALQFYDWMYRHDQLLPPSDAYADPLNRPLALETIRALIDAAHRHGIAALPYTAVYAASPEFYRAHPDWALFKADGQPLDFAAGFLIYMNPAENSPWSRHLLEQFDDVLHALNFDGIHIDQYGDPIAARDAAGSIVMLDRAFRAFVDAATERVKAIRSNAAVVFNCVGNWPIETIAGSRADLMYIEVWKPHTQWRDLRRLIVEAQRLNHKPVVLAAYIDPAREHNVRLANAIVFASGGNHIELGEPNALLADPYFPKYGRMSPALIPMLRAYYDFAVRYENVLALDTCDATPAWSGRVIIEGVSTDWQQDRDAVWPIVRAGDGITAISLINLIGLASAHWTEPLPGAPTPLSPLTVKVYVDRPAVRAWWASPDGDSSRAALVAPQVQSDARGDYLDIALAGLMYWTLIVLEWER